MRRMWTQSLLAAHTPALTECLPHLPLLFTAFRTHLRESDGHKKPSPSMHSPHPPLGKGPSLLPQLLGQGLALILSTLN